TLDRGRRSIGRRDLRRADAVERGQRDRAREAGEEDRLLAPQREQRECSERTPAGRRVLTPDQQTDGARGRQIQPFAAGLIERRMEGDERVVGVGRIETPEATGKPARRPAALRCEQAHARPQIEEHLRRTIVVLADLRHERHASAAQDGGGPEAVELTTAGGGLLRTYHEPRFAAATVEQATRGAALQRGFEHDLALAAHAGSAEGVEVAGEEVDQLVATVDSLRATRDRPDPTPVLGDDAPARDAAAADLRAEGHDPRRVGGWRVEPGVRATEGS